MAFRKKSYKRRAPKRRVHKRKSYAKKTSIKRVVKAVIHRAAETKNIQRYNLGMNIYPANSASFLGSIIELGPGSTMLITQGAGQGSRIGNRIETVSHTFKGTLTPNPYNATTNPDPRPLQVKMWIFYDKTDPTAVPNPVGNPFFQDGSSVVGFANDLVDHWRPINTDRYRILAQRTFKLGYSQYAGTAATVANQGANQAYSNNDFKMNCPFSINLTKHQIKQIRFNDANNEPMTRRMFAMFQPVEASGTQMAATHNPCGVQFMEDYRYKDM